MDVVLKERYKGLEGKEMPTSNRKIAVVMAHVVVWLLFLSLPAFFNPRRHGGGIGSFVDDLLEPARWTNGLLLVIVFYFNSYIAIPLLYFRKRYFLLTISFAACAVSFFLLNYLLIPAGPRDLVTDVYTLPGNSFNLFMFIIVYVFSFALCIYRQWLDTNEQMLNTEISFLKAQINPHFLFNTLNSIYSLALAKSDSAPDAIVKLSGMMRYSVSEANQSLVPVAKEIEYISNYIELQRLRLAENVKITCEIAGDASGKEVAPLLLIPFVENAFKHGVNAAENSDIRIKIEIVGNDLSLSVFNNKVFMRKDLERGTGLGVRTTQKRLKLLYPGAHTLDVIDNDREYAVLLKVSIV